MNCPHSYRLSIVEAPAHICAECLMARLNPYKGGGTPYKGKREAWEYSSDYRASGDATYYTSTRGEVQISGHDERTWK